MSSAAIVWCARLPTHLPANQTQIDIYMALYMIVTMSWSQCNAKVVPASFLHVLPGVCGFFCVHVAKSTAEYETVSQTSHAHPRYGTYQYIDQKVWCS